MFERTLRILKIACLFLGILVLVQVFSLLRKEDPLQELNANPLERASQFDSMESEPPGEKNSEDPRDPQKPPPGKGDERKDSTPPLPEPYRIIATSGIFGTERPKKEAQPALLGIVGRYAILRAPDGRLDLVAEGSDLGGVKVLRINTNRVLLEHEGRQLELTIFSGLGSRPLLPKGKEKSQ